MDGDKGEVSRLGFRDVIGPPLSWGTLDSDHVEGRDGVPGTWSTRETVLRGGGGESSDTRYPGGDWWSKLYVGRRVWA